MEKEMTFEEALVQLETVVKKLEKPDLPLEESIKLFEEGMRLSRLCNTKLDQAQQRVELLQKQASGEIKPTPFEAKSVKEPAPLVDAEQATLDDYLADSDEETPL
ncbi:MAG: exodeoxyribonuclease VII small subunit [Acidobacteriota bacterium]